MNWRWSVGFLVALVVVLAGINFWWTARVVNEQAAAQRRERAAQQHQGQIIGQKLCTTLGKLAALTPPPGDPAANPARAYDQNLHATLAQLGPDIGCR